MVTANICALLANCAYVAIGVARINGNNPDDRERVFVSSSPADYDKAAGRFINANTDEVRATAKEAQLFRALCEALAGKGIMEEDANA